MIRDVFLGWETNKASVLGRDDLIVEGLAPPIRNRAKYFTINFGDRIGPDYQKKQLFIELYRNNNKYEVLIQEPRFFTLNYIPVAFPTISVVVNKSEIRGPRLKN